MAGSVNPLGAYIAGDSLLHRLDPRAKLGILLAWTVALLNVESWPVLAAVALAVVLLAVSARVPVGRFAAGMAPMALVLAVLVVGNALRFDGSGSLALAGAVGVSPEGLMCGCMAAARVVLMVALSLLVTATTTAAALTEALTSILGPLRRAKVPVDDVATMLSIALRFIPVCSDQLGRIVMAQKARGAYSRSGPAARVRAWAQAAVPLMVGLFRRSDALAEAMASRCYHASARTRLTTLSMGPGDVAVLACGCVLAVVCALAF